MAKDKDYIRLIQSTRWVKLRRRVLTAHPVCQRCDAEGRIGVPATEVHHVTPVEYAATRQGKEQLMFNPANLQALCHACHVQTHVEMGRSGKAATKRRTAALVQAFKEKFLQMCCTLPFLG